MSPRLLKNLAVGCSILVALWLFSLYRQVPHSKSPYAKVFDSATQIQLQQGDNSLYLTKDKQTWAVSGGAHGPSYPVDEERLRSFTTSLPDVQLEDVISERKESARDFEVDASGLRVTLRNGQNKVIVDGVFGKQATDGTHIYFRYADQPTVYLARGIFRGELGTADLALWRNRTLVTLTENQINAFEIQSKGNTVQVQGSSNSWTVNNGPADAEKVTLWRDALVHLRADDFASVTSTDTPKWADLNVASVTAKTPSAQVTLHIGALDAKGKRFPVSTSADNGIAWVSEPRIRAILLSPADFKSK